MIDAVPPVFIYLIGAIIIPLIRIRRLQQAVALLIPVIAFIDILSVPQGMHWRYTFLDYEIVLGRVDKLSLIFAYVFIIISFISMVYALHIKESGQHAAAYIYAGSALGVVFAGDLFSLFVFWELMAASSVFLIWYSRTKASLDAGFRYIMVHMAGGCLLMAGIVIHVAQTGSIEFNLFEFQSPGSALILFGFIINAAVPPLHAWLPDAYPEGTITGSVFMTAFTTKSAVYVLARSFAGLEVLVWLGAIMTLYGVVYAVMEKDIRRLLAYHIVSQVGYMVCGVGLGSEMAINGASAHAFCHILYKALLFMGTGAVIHVTGRRNIPALTGRNLYQKMPLTLVFYMVGAFSISGVPLFNGFISKTMVVAAAGFMNRPAIELMLHLASVGTWLSVGLKLPWGTWFGLNQGQGTEDPVAAKEPPVNMLVGMGLASALCLLLGIYPKLLYDHLPYAVSFHPYEPSHVVATMQLLLLTAAGFWLFLKKIMAGDATLNVDTDWFYRMFGRGVMQFCRIPLNRISLKLSELSENSTAALGRFGNNPYAPLDRLRNTRDDQRHKNVSNPPPLSNPDQDQGKDPYRFSIGLGVFVSLVFLFFFGLMVVAIPNLAGG
jgi:multicomponent Na+:H+ antiporter subunit D